MSAPTIRFIRLKPAEPGAPPTIHVNVNTIATVSPDSRAGALIELLNGKTILVQDKLAEILTEIHSQAG